MIYFFAKRFILSFIIYMVLKPIKKVNLKPTIQFQHLRSAAGTLFSPLQWSTMSSSPRGHALFSLVSERSHSLLSRMAVESSVSLGGGLNLSVEVVDREVVNRPGQVLSNMQLDQKLGVDHLAVDLPIVLATVVTNSWAIWVIYRNYRVSKRKQTKRKNICVMLLHIFYQSFFVYIFLLKAL